MKVAWEILKALGLRERGPVLIACPTCGRLQFDMDTVVAEIEQRLEQYAEPIEVAVLGCAVNGIGEASHADFGITGAKNEGLIFAHGKPLRKVPQARAGRRSVRGDRQVARPRQRRRGRSKAAEGAAWLQRIEEENADELTPERIAQMEAAPPQEEGRDITAEPFLKPGQAAASSWTRSPRRRLGAPLHPAPSRQPRRRLPARRARTEPVASSWS